MPREIENILKIVIAFLGAYAVAFWFCLVVWTFRDIQQRTRDVLVQVLATLLVFLFNLPGLLLYVILRPSETLAEVYARNLEEESLIQEIEDRLACPNCKSRIEEDFVVCPECRTELKRICVACNRLLNLGWAVCPYCGTSANAALSPAIGPMTTTSVAQVQSRQ